MKYAFAGNREISVKVLSFLISNNCKPSALLLCDETIGSNNDELIKISGLQHNIIIGNSFKEDEAIESLRSLKLDYIFGIHYPYLIPSKVLAIPEIGFLNLHPAYLPYNKGWHTPSWAILENTLYGATLHFMSEQLDAGDIVHQKQCKIFASDTADSLYQRVLDLEFEVFKESFADLLSLKPKRIKQTSAGTAHTKSQLKNQQKIDLERSYKAEELINKFRALTTNKTDEAAYFEKDGELFYVQVTVKKL